MRILVVYNVQGKDIVCRVLGSGRSSPNYVLKDQGPYVGSTPWPSLFAPVIREFAGVGPEACNLSLATLLGNLYVPGAMIR